MKILITGGTGLIGTRLIFHFQQLGIKDITVLTRNVVNARKLLGDKVHLLTKLHLDDVDGQDVIINLQGEPIANKRWTARQKNKICQSRLKITEQLATFINQSANPPSTFISGSAIGFYGRQNGHTVSETNTPPYNEFTHQLCNEWEQHALQARCKTRVVNLRTGIVLDAEKGALCQMSMPFKFGLGGYIGNGQQYISWIHIDDMVMAIMHIINTPTIIGPVNMTAPLPATNKKFNQVLAHTLGSSSRLRTPEIFIKILFGEMSDLFIYGQNVVPKLLLDSGYTFKHSELTGALDDLFNGREK